MWDSIKSVKLSAIFTKVVMVLVVAVPMVVGRAASMSRR